MPMRNGMGPQGMGPKTGRGFGYCGTAGFGNSQGYGRGFGRGQGICRQGGGGWRGTGLNAAPLSENQYAGMLQAEADFLEKRLSEIKTELNKSAESSSENQNEQ